MGRSLSREKVPLISPEKPDSTAVDRYILDFGRILFWLKKSLSVDETALVNNISKRLVLNVIFV